MLTIESSNHGAELISIKLNGKEMLHQGNSVLDENGKPFWGRHAPVLFPIVGKLKDNKTKINGNIYEMNQHGFARDMDFKELEKTEKKHKYVLKFNSETLKKFPFKFELYVEYEIIGNELTTKYTVINKDNKDMLFGIGGHPAFICNYCTENYELEFEKQEDKIEFYKLQEGLIKTKPINNILENNKIKLTKNIFDEDAIIMKNITSDRVTLINLKNNKKVLEFDFTGFPYLAIWSKKGAPFVCIEPWQNHTDSINSNGEFCEKEDIIKLRSNEKFECKYKVIFND
ncbi:MAG: aldose 1-epimerase family protein [Clostridia bacterium]|nr:aldose 1-epimerase family protein [Clostridia bacterium]